MAAAYNENRMLFVGTTNIDYGQTWVWNMSLIAKDGQPRALSSGVARLCIVPHRLSAGGNRWSSVRRRGRPFKCRHCRTGRDREPRRLHHTDRATSYLVDNGKADTARPQALRRALGDVAATTISVMMDQSMQTAMTRSYFGTKVLGYNFNMVAHSR